MKTIETKTLFIALLLSTVVPSLPAEVDQLKFKRQIDLLRALKERDLAGIDQACKAGADINYQIRTCSGFTPLMFALNKCSLAAVLPMAEQAGFFESLFDYVKKSIGGGHSAKVIDVVRLLLEKEADVGRKNFGGSTVLMEESNRPGRLEVIKLLLEKNSDVNEKNDQGDTALIEANQGPGRLEVVNLLLERNSDVNMTNNRGNTALITAALASNGLEKIGLLLKYGADVNMTNNKGNTALIVVTSCTPFNDLEKVGLLLKYNADVNMTNNKGDAALMHVLRLYDDKNPSNKKNIIRLLIKNDANVNIKNKLGCTAWDCAHRNPGIQKTIKDSIIGRRKEVVATLLEVREELSEVLGKMISEFVIYKDQCGILET